MPDIFNLSTGITDKSKQQKLRQPLDESKVDKRPGGGGSQLSYLKGHEAINTANLVFGEGSWGYDLVDICNKEFMVGDGKVVGGYWRAVVRLQVSGCVPVTEVGLNKYSVSGTFQKDVDAEDMAYKGAVTDALKRALRTFGDQFGNRLYDSDFVDGNVEKPKNLEAKKRRDEFREFAQEAYLDESEEVLEAKQEVQEASSNIRPIKEIPAVATVHVGKAPTTPPDKDNDFKNREEMFEHYASLLEVVKDKTSSQKIWAEYAALCTKKGVSDEDRDDALKEWYTYHWRRCNNSLRPEHTKPLLEWRAKAAS